MLVIKQKWEGNYNDYTITKHYKPSSLFRVPCNWWQSRKAVLARHSSTLRRVSSSPEPRKQFFQGSSHNPQAVTFSFSLGIVVAWVKAVPVGCDVWILGLQLVVLQPCWRKCISEGGLWQLTTLPPYQFALLAWCLRWKMRLHSLPFQPHAGTSPTHVFHYGVLLWNQGETKSPGGGPGCGVLPQP